ncbi:hypothetical protein [Faecalibacter sp. LW9]|uniref:hypothetical protein n=1 Tax=Faecalibacter sp. LW9 TaxID=3103144 RepID=UPI002AFEC83E|nr:hypothetical protein [Faecalibacter sp. LW9]
MNRFISIRFVFLFSLIMGCQQKNQPMNENSKNASVDSLMEAKKNKLKEKFNAQSEANKKKFDSLGLVEDSLRNKKNLSGFDDDAPVFNQLENK